MTYAEQDKILQQLMRDFDKGARIFGGKKFIEWIDAEGKQHWLDIDEYLQLKFKTK